jgi:hypothetical protein
MTTTLHILTTFTSKVDLEKEYTRSELGKMPTEVFKKIHEGGKGEKKAKKKVRRRWWWSLCWLCWRMRRRRRWRRRCLDRI